MAKVKYIGLHMPKGIYEVKDKKMQSLLQTGDFELPGKKVETNVQKLDKTNKTKNVNGDLNNDGVFDEKDKTIAAKVLRKKYNG